MGERCYYEKGGDADVLRWGRVEFVVPVGHPGDDVPQAVSWRSWAGPYMAQGTVGMDSRGTPPPFLPWSPVLGPRGV